ncbi:MAG: hypothetical protein PHU53_01660 [Thermoplasmata archaeon]|nr:hypothetical protein [Thermoplasmata archaeon]
MKISTAVFAAIVTAAMVLTAIPLVGPTGLTSAEGTRAGEVGWQYDTFAQNIMLNVTPEIITTSDAITITISSKVGEVWINRANLWGVITPSVGPASAFSYTFERLNDTYFTCTIGPFPMNGNQYEIEFYVIAYDYYYEPMDSRTYTTLFYNVLSSGWKNSTFDGNIELTYWPMNVNATEEVLITLVSRNNISISGANLYVTYETEEGEIQSGGWNFTKSNANATEMSQIIPGYPAGTNVTFWVTAWDQYNSLMTSKMYNYSVMGIAAYTDYPFEYTDESGDRCLWIPDDHILIAMTGMMALGIPLFIYLYALGLKRRKKAMDMVTTKKADAPKEEDSDE